MSFLETHLNEVFDLESAYQFEQVKDTGLYQSYTFEDDHGNKYQLMFTNIAVLGKRVQTVRLGQQVPGGKYYKPLIKKIGNPYALIATIIQIFIHHTQETSKGKLKGGFAFGIPETAFGAYSGMVKKIIQRQLRNKWNLFDSDVQVQDDQYTKDLQFVYLVNKSKSVKDIFSGEQGKVVLSGEKPQEAPSNTATMDKQPEVTPTVEPAVKPIPNLGDLLKAKLEEPPRSSPFWNTNAATFASLYKDWVVTWKDPLTKAMETGVVTGEVDKGIYVHVTDKDGQRKIVKPSIVLTATEPAKTEPKVSETPWKYMKSDEFGAKYKGQKVSFNVDGGADKHGLVGGATKSGNYVEVIVKDGDESDKHYLYPSEVKAIYGFPEADTVLTAAQNMDATEFAQKYKDWTVTAYSSVTGKEHTGVVMGTVTPSLQRFKMEVKDDLEAPVGYYPHNVKSMTPPVVGVKTEPEKPAVPTPDEFQTYSAEYFAKTYKGWTVVAVVDGNPVAVSGNITGGLSVTGWRFEVLDAWGSIHRFKPSEVKVMIPPNGNAEEIIKATAPKAWNELERNDFLVKYTGMYSKWKGDEVLIIGPSVSDDMIRVKISDGTRYAVKPINLEKEPYEKEPFDPSKVKAEDKDTWKDLTREQFLPLFKGYWCTVEGYDDWSHVFTVEDGEPYYGGSQMIFINRGKLGDPNYVYQYTTCSITQITQLQKERIIRSKADEFRKKYPLGSIWRISYDADSKYVEGKVYGAVVGIDEEGVTFRTDSGKDWKFSNPADHLSGMKGNIAEEDWLNSAELVKLAGVLGYQTKVKFVKDTSSANPIEYTKLSQTERDYLAKNVQIVDLSSKPIHSLENYRQAALSSFSVGPLKFDYNGDIAQFAQQIRGIPFLPPEQKAEFVRVVTGNTWKEEDAYLKLKDVLPLSNSNALMEYTGSSYKNINNVLRGKASDSYGLEQIVLIDKEFEDHGIRLSADDTLYRSQKMTIGDLKALENGKEFVMYGYVSTSTKVSFAMGWKDIGYANGSRTLIDRNTSFPPNAEDDKQWKGLMVIRGLDNTLVLYPGENGRHVNECEFVIHRNTKVVLDKTVEYPLVWNHEDKFFVVSLRITGSHKAQLDEGSSFGRGFKMFSDKQNKQNRVLNDINTHTVVPPKKPEKYEGSERWEDDAFEHEDKDKSKD